MCVCCSESASPTSALPRGDFKFGPFCFPSSSVWPISMTLRGEPNSFQNSEGSGAGVKGGCCCDTTQMGTNMVHVRINRNTHCTQTRTQKNVCIHVLCVLTHCYFGDYTHTHTHTHTLYYTHTVLDTETPAWSTLNWANHKITLLVSTECACACMCVCVLCVFVYSTYMCIRTYTVIITSLLHTKARPS